MAINLDALLVNVIVKIIIVSPVLWLSGRALVGKEKAKFTDAVVTVILGTVVGAIFGYYFTGFLALIIQLILWLLIVKHFFDCGWLKALAISIFAVIVFAEILLAPHQTGGCRSKDPHTMGLIDRRLWDNRETDPQAIEAEFRGPKGRAWLMRWLPARAHDNGMFVVFSNGVGVDDDEIRTGNAMIIDPYGRILAETWKAADCMVVADLDASLLEDCTGRRWIKTRRPELYGLLTKPTGIEEDTRSVLGKMKPGLQSP